MTNYEPTNDKEFQDIQPEITHINQQISNRHYKVLAKYLDLKASIPHSPSLNYGYYCNGMSNSKELSEKIDKNHQFVLERSSHGHANLTFISYGFDRETKINKVYKHFDDRKWFYVIFNRESEKVQVRQDLIQSWAEHNDKFDVLVVSDCGKVWDIPMSEFYSPEYVQMKSENKWNSEGNIVKVFDLPKPVFEMGEADFVQYDLDAVSWLKDCFDNVGHTNYASHRVSKKGFINVARYNSDGTMKVSHKMKSLKQVYDLCGFENLGSYRSFTRLMTRNGISVSQFLKNKKGDVFFVSANGTACPEFYEEAETIKEEVIVVDELVQEALSDDIDNIPSEVNPAMTEKYIIDLTDIEKIPESNAEIGKLQVEKITRQKPIIKRSVVTRDSLNQVSEEFARMCELSDKPKRQTPKM